MAGQMPLTFEMQVMGDAEVRSKFDSVGDAAEGLGKKADTAGKNAKKAEGQYLDAAKGIAEVSVNAFQLWQNYDDLEKGETRIAAAEKRVDTARAGLLSSQERLNKLVENGITSGPEYEEAVIRLDAAQQGLGLAQVGVKESQEDLSDAQTSFALSVVPTSLSAVSGLTSSLQALGKSQILSNIATGLSAKIHGSAAFGALAHAGATLKAGFATKGLTLATKLFHLAMGPVGLIILGVSTAIGLFATNAFGLRDAGERYGKGDRRRHPYLAAFAGHTRGNCQHIISTGGSDGGPR